MKIKIILIAIILILATQLMGRTKDPCRPYLDHAYQQLAVAKTYNFVSGGYAHKLEDAIEALADYEKCKEND